MDPEAQRRRVIRKAAGAGLVRDGDPCEGPLVCVDCPDDRHTPPYRYFGLRSHVRDHERRYGHTRFLVYCFVHCDFHSREAMEEPLVLGWLAEGPPQRPPSGPVAVVAALEVLRSAGYLVRVAEPPSLPEPEPLLLPYREAEALKYVRENPGATTRDLSQHFGVKDTSKWLTFLKRGGHVRMDGFTDGFARHYATHDQPIGKVRPRERVLRGNGRGRPSLAERAQTYALRPPGG